MVTDAVGAPGLLVERFDRKSIQATDGAAYGVGLAVEDACQVLGLPPGDKYTISAEAALGALATVCQASLPAARQLFAQLVFAYLTGNGDAHAKNFSIVQDSDGEMAPDAGIRPAQLSAVRRPHDGDAHGPADLW